MSPPELFEDVALHLLADLQRHQREGAPMSIDPVEAEARRTHAENCRRYDPDVTDARIADYWDQLGDESHSWERNAARLRLEKAATR